MWFQDTCSVFHLYHWVHIPYNQHAKSVSQKPRTVLPAKKQGVQWYYQSLSQCCSFLHLALVRERESLYRPSPTCLQETLEETTFFFVRETGEGLELGRPMTRSMCTDTIKQTQQPRVFLLVTEMQRRQLTHCLVYGGGSQSGHYLQLCAGSWASTPACRACYHIISWYISL